MDSANTKELESVSCEEPMVDPEKLQKCVCCLADSGPFVNLTGCSHTNFLETHFKFYDFFSTLVCLTCHNQLKNISEFKDLVARSYSILNEQIPSHIWDTSTKLSQSKLIIVSIDKNKATYQQSEMKRQTLKFKVDNLFEVQVKAEPLSDKEDLSSDNEFLAIKRKIDLDNDQSITDQLEVKSKRAKIDHKPNNTKQAVKQKTRHKKTKSAKESVKSQRQTATLKRDITVFICYHCNKHFVTKVLLIDHMKSHFPANTKNSFKCKYCKLEADSKESIENHLILHGFKKQNCICKCCGYRFKNQEVLDSHEKKCSAKSHSKKQHENETDTVIDKSLICSICKLKFCLSSDLTNHMKTHTTNDVEKNANEKAKQFLCQQCGKHFAAEDLLTTHMKTHSEQSDTGDTYKCRYCKFEADSTDIMNQHLVLHGFKTQSFICSICGYRFKSQKILDSHAAKCIAKSQKEEKRLKFKKKF